MHMCGFWFSSVIKVSFLYRCLDLTLLCWSTGLVRMKDTKGKKGAPMLVKSTVKDKTRKVEEKYVALFVSFQHRHFCPRIWSESRSCSWNTLYGLWRDFWLVYFVVLQCFCFSLYSLKLAVAETSRRGKVLWRKQKLRSLNYQRRQPKQPKTPMPQSGQPQHSSCFCKYIMLNLFSKQYCHNWSVWYRCGI